MIPKLRKKLVRKAKKNPKTTIVAALASILSVAAIIGYKSGAFNSTPSPASISDSSSYPSSSGGPVPQWFKITLEDDPKPRFFYGLRGYFFPDEAANALAEAQSATMKQPYDWGKLVVKARNKNIFNEQYNEAEKRNKRRIELTDPVTGITYFYSNVEAAFQTSKLFCVPIGDLSNKKWTDNPLSRLQMYANLADGDAGNAFGTIKHKIRFLQWEQNVKDDRGLCMESILKCPGEDPMSRPTMYAGHGRWTTMYILLKQKFQRGSKLALRLEKTGSCFLLEHNPEKGRDGVWSSNKDGKGYNWLGLQLMLIREENRGGETTVKRWLTACFGGELKDNFEDSLENRNKVGTRNAEFTQKKQSFWNKLYDDPRLSPTRAVAEYPADDVDQLVDNYWAAWDREFYNQAVAAGKEPDRNYSTEGSIRWIPNGRRLSHCPDVGYPGIQSGLWGSVVKEAAEQVNAATDAPYTRANWDGTHSKYKFKEGCPFPDPYIIAFYGNTPTTQPGGYVPKDKPMWDRVQESEFLGNFWDTGA